VIKEAQAFGVVPIVYEYASSVHHLVEQDRDGRVVPLNDIQTFVRVLIATMRDTEKRMQMATEAVRSVQAHSAPVVLEKWIRLFEDVAGDSPESSTA
jgi:glycosyltransferase involved in cell wall biosynthesis